MTTEMLPTAAQTSYRTAEEVAGAVLARMDELADPSSEAHELFYEMPGIRPAELMDARRPAGGHTVLLGNETEHFVNAPDGSVLPVETFKRRGARAAAIFAMQERPGLSTLTTGSAGGHGQGVAAAALEFGLTAEVHTKSAVSPVKADRMSALNATVVSKHATLGNALKAACRGTDPGTDKAFIHPYDHIETMAGQGTLGQEFFEALQRRAEAGELNLQKDFVDIVVPLGGGGLAAAVAVAIKRKKELGLAGDNVRVVAASASNKERNAWVDGTQTATGRLTSLIVHNTAYVQGHVMVSDLEVADAMYNLTGIYNKCIEPAGALAYAGIRQMIQKSPVRNGNKRRTFVAPVTGANVTPATFQFATDLRTEAYHARLSVLGHLASYATSTSTSPTIRRNQIASSILG